MWGLLGLGGYVLMFQRRKHVNLENMLIMRMKDTQ